MLLRRRLGTGRGVSLCVLRTALRHAGSSNNNHNANDKDTTGRTINKTTRGETSGATGASEHTVQPPTSGGLKGWKRFGLPPSESSSAATPSSIHSVVGQKREDDEARRRAASERLADMFMESGRHTQWMQDQHRKAAQTQHYDEEVPPVHRVRQAPVDHNKQRDATFDTAVAPSGAGKARGGVRSYAYDEDADDGARSSAGSFFPQQEATSALTPATTSVDVLEQELLDDNFLYYPPPASLPLTEVDQSRESVESALAPAKERYVPGQQIIPPGFTRYRVDVQYQGSDFDGWYKSVRRTRPSAAAQGSDLAEGTSRHFARTVLEEALAVALDVATVSVTAAVIPETGVSVRRLCCHVDIPSEVELQPRTILQRATLWLHQRRQPLAVLSCYPCKNQDFHARHTGVRRVYCYRILNRIAPPLFDAGLQWHVDRYLDVARMQRMAKVMEGTHDYGYFADPKMANALRRAAAHTGGGGGAVVSSAYSPEHEPLLSHGLPAGQAPAAPKVDIARGLSQLERAAALPTFNEYGQRVVTYQAKPREYHKAHTNLPTIRTIDKIDVVRQEDEVLIWFVGQSFLRHQIRNMVSVLKAGGHGLWDDQELQHAFQTGFEISRKKFARERLPPAPVHGLTLWDVDYPAQHTSDFVSYVDAGPYEPHDVATQV